MSINWQFRWEMRQRGKLMEEIQENFKTKSIPENTISRFIGAFYSHIQQQKGGIHIHILKTFGSFRWNGKDISYTHISTPPYA